VKITRRQIRRIIREATREPRDRRRPGRTTRWNFTNLASDSFWVTWDQGVEGPLESIEAASAVVRRLRNEPGRPPRNVTIVDEDPT